VPLLATSFLPTIPMILVVDLSKEVLQQPTRISILFGEVTTLAFGVADQIGMAREYLYWRPGPYTI
jgi:hypothetical protein